MKRILLFIVAVVCATALYAADYANVIVPRPLNYTAVEGSFILAPKTVVRAESQALAHAATIFTEDLSVVTGSTLSVKRSAPRNGAINLTIDSSLQAEEYKLNITSAAVNIVGGTERAVFYGLQSLLQIAAASDAVKGGVSLSGVKITDKPHFEYRGALLDVCRHIFSVEDVKRYIDILALHKVNKFHWHLTEDQGWRIEIKAYPELTEKGSMRKETLVGHGLNPVEWDGTPYGGYYTQDEIREVVAYAAERYIEIIPEIERPGHSQAALHALPWLGCNEQIVDVWTTWGVTPEVLCAGKETTYEFLEKVLDEVIELFPSELIHIGGDECPKDRWVECEHCQAMMKAQGLENEEQLQGYLVARIEKFLNAHGRRIIGWDEILEGGVTPSATVMAWRGENYAYEAARQGHDAIMAPTSYLYFDYYQTKDTETEPLAIGGYVPVERVYSFNPQPDVLTPEQQKHIIGVQANLWTEYVPTYSHVEYMLLPRMAALCEIQWSPASKKNYEDFLKRLPQLVDVYDVKKYNYATHVFDIKADMTPDPEEGVLKVSFRNIDNSPIHYTLDGTEPTASSPKYTDTLKIKESCVVKAVGVRSTGNTRVFQEEVSVHKASFKPITMLKPINRQYYFEGAGTLVDGLKGNHNYKTGRWIAFFKNDMEAVIDLKTPTEVSSVSINTLVEKGDWVFDARRIAVYVSEDGENFTEVASEEYPALTLDNPNQIYDHTLTFDAVTTKYLKVYLQPEHSLPDWHGGKGHPSFVFLDEIVVN